MLQHRKLTYENALTRAAVLCSKCEQCSPDILKKLSGWGLSSNDSERVIGRLEELRFLDDERFVRAYAHDKLVFSGWGRMKIARGLWAKRLPRELIDIALESIDEEEYEDVAIRVMSSRTRLYPDMLESYEGRTKLLRFGAGRGFELSLLTKIITTLRKQHEEE